MTPDATPTTLYRLFDADDRLLYVGISLRLPRRIKEHSKDKPWWMDVTRSTFEHFPTRAEAQAAEAHAIIVENPAHNVAGRARTEDDLWTRLVHHIPIAGEVEEYLSLINPLTDGYCEHYLWYGIRRHDDWDWWPRRLPKGSRRWVVDNVGWCRTRFPREEYDRIHDALRDAHPGVETLQGGGKLWNGSALIEVHDEMDRLELEQFGPLSADEKWLRSEQAYSIAYQRLLHSAPVCLPEFCSGGCYR